MLRKFFLLIASLVLIVFLAACASQSGAVTPTEMAQAAQPTATAVPATATPQPTLTATPEPTFTPTITLTPTPTEAPLPELGSFWQGYVDAHSKEVSVKIVEGVPSLVGTMSSGQEVTVAKYKDGKWVSETSMEPFKDAGGTFRWRDAAMFRIFEGVPNADGSIGIKPEDLGAIHAEALKGWELIKDTIGENQIDYHASATPSDMTEGPGINIFYTNLKGVDLLFMGMSRSGEDVVQVFVLPTKNGPVILIREPNFEATMGTADDGGEEFFDVISSGNDVGEGKLGMIFVAGSGVYNANLNGEVNAQQFEDLMKWFDPASISWWETYVANCQRDGKENVLRQTFQEPRVFITSFVDKPW